MRIGVSALVIGMVLTAACTKEEIGTDKKSPAREVGKAGYKITKETEKAAKKAGEKIKEATREIHQGWKEAQHEEKAKPK